MSVELRPPRPAADEDVEAVLDCLRSGWLTMGPRIAAFESAFAGTVGVEHAVATASGPAALHLALAAVGVGPGDRVAVPAVGGEGAASAARRLGAEAAPVEVDARCPLLGADATGLALRDGARAVVAVDLAGHPADLAGLRAVCDRHGAALVSVAALGAEGAGRHADAAVFVLDGASPVDVGEGAMVVTGDEAVAARARLLRSHAMTSGTWDRHRGHAASYDIVDIGFNARLDEARAALGASRLERLGEEVDRRRAVAEAYRAALDGVDGVASCFDAARLAAAAPEAFLVAVRDAGAVASALGDAGVETLRAGDAVLGLPVIGVDPDRVEDVATRLRGAAAR